MSELTWDERMANLPKWAREHIADLQRNLDATTRRKQELEEERVTNLGAENNARVTWELLMEGEHGLPKYANVRFHINRERGVYVTLRWNESENMIDINASDPIVIRPIATNAVYLTTRER